MAASSVYSANEDTMLDFCKCYTYTGQAQRTMHGRRCEKSTIKLGADNLCAAAFAWTADGRTTKRSYTLPPFHILVC
jgi:hypothetical protein